MSAIKNVASAEAAATDARAEPHCPKGKVLHVIGSLGIGGSENLLVNHIRCLAQAYPLLSNEVCVLGRRSAADARYLDRMPVVPHFLEFSGRYRSPLDAGRCIGALRRLIARLAPDIVHSYLWNADVFTAVAVAGMPVRRVSHILDRRGDRNASRLVSQLRTRATGWLLRRGLTSFAAVSDACREFAMRHYLVDANRVITAHNGIWPDEFAVSRELVFSGSPAVVGMISRFAEEKGHAYLVEAVSMLAATDAPVRVLIAGDGGNRSAVEAMVDGMALADRIQFVGRVDSASSFYRQLDVFVVPSIDAEGLPTTILEAMSAGLPVIATAIGGAREAIGDGREGLIVPPRDAAAIASAIQHLIEDPQTARRMGDAGRKRVLERFTVDKMTRTIVEGIYLPLLSGARSRQ